MCAVGGGVKLEACKFLLVTVACKEVKGLCNPGFVFADHISLNAGE